MSGEAVLLLIFLLVVVKMFLCCLCICQRANLDPEYTREDIRSLAYSTRLASTRELQDTASEQRSSQTQAAPPLLQEAEEEYNPPEEGYNLPTSNYNPTVEEYGPPEGEYNPPQEELCPSQRGYNPAQQVYNPDHQGSGYVDPQIATTNNVTLIDFESHPSLPYTDNFQAC